MAQSGYTPISLYYSTTAAQLPSAGNLANGELAINITDGKLYYKDNGGSVQLLASNTVATGAITSVSIASSNGLAGTSSGGTTPTLTLSTTVTGLLKGNGTAISAAVSGTDYAPATSGSSILYGNGAGGFSNVTIGTGVTFAGGTLSATGAGGTVTSVSVSSANGFAGTSSGGATPALTLSTTVTGLIKGNGTAMSAAVAGTDYAVATTGTSAQLLANNGSGGFSNVTVGANLTLSAGTLSAAIGTATISATAPGSPSSGQLWYDSTNGVMLIYYNSQWVEDYESQYSNTTTVPDMNGGLATTTSWTYALNCGGAA